MWSMIFYLIFSVGTDQMICRYTNNTRILKFLCKSIELAYPVLGCCIWFGINEGGDCTDDNEDTLELLVSKYHQEGLISSAMRMSANLCIRMDCSNGLHRLWNRCVLPCAYE